MLLNNENNDLKTSIRNKIRIERYGLSKQEINTKSKNIFDKIEELEVFKTANVIMLYWSVQNEVYTHQTIEKWKTTKKILLPSIFGTIIKPKEFSSVESMSISEKLKILEPKGETFYEDKIDIVIVPGLAFDSQKNRLGYGKGFYDKFFENQSTYKIGVCFNFQIVDQIPINNHDVAMDLIVFD